MYDLSYIFNVFSPGGGSYKLISLNKGQHCEVYPSESVKVVIDNTADRSQVELPVL